MSGIATAIAVGVAGLGTGIYEASTEAGIQNKALGMAGTTQQEQQYYNQMLQQLIANPSSVSSLPGYQFQLSQGSAAVAAGEGPSGHAGSGNEGAALTMFGQGLASSFYGQQASLLASLSGVTAASSPAQDTNAATAAAGQSASTLSSLLNSLGFYGTLGSRGLGTGGSPAGTPAAVGNGTYTAPAGGLGVIDG